MVVWLRGTPIYERVREEVRARVRELEEEIGLTPGLAILLLNDDPVERETQLRYVQRKERDVRYVGGVVYRFELWDVPVERRTKEAIRLIQRLNAADDVTGILVQKPLPPGVDEKAILAAIDPRKDVDALTPDNRRLLLWGYDLERDLLPATAAGIVELLAAYGIDVAGMDAVVVGRSDLVGRPLSLMLLNMDATVTIVHSRSRNAKRFVAEADLVVSAVGRPPELYGSSGWRITGSDVKEGAVVIGVGGKYDPASGRWFFDVDEASVAEKAKALTPNLGGVGPMTRARLLKNLVIAARRVAASVKAR